MTDSPILISIVVPTRNRLEFLRACVRSLVNQSYSSTGYEVIVVDDGSNPDTNEVIAHSVAESDTPPVRLVQGSGRGPSAARNRGIEAARGDVIVFVDDDVVAPTDWLESMMAGILRHPNAQCFTGRIHLRLEGKVPRMCGREPLGESELDLGEEDLSLIPERIVAANMAVTRKGLSLAGGFDEGLPVYGEETEWGYRLIRAGGEAIYLPEASLWHRRGAEDLRVRRLIRSRFRQGRGWPRIAPYIEKHVSVLEGILRGGARLGHGLRRWCWVGVFDSAFWLGYSFQCIQMLLRKEGATFVRWTVRGDRERLLRRIPRKSWRRH